MTLLVDREKWVDVLESFFQLTGISSSVFSLPQRQLLLAIGAPTLRSWCETAGIQAAGPYDELFQKDTSLIVKDIDEKLLLAACPLIVGDEHVAQLLLGQTSEAANATQQTEKIRAALTHLQTIFTILLEQTCRINKAIEDAGLLRAIFDNAPYAVAISSLQDHRFIAANPAFGKAVGLQPEQLLNDSTLNLAQQNNFTLSQKIAETVSREGRFGPEIMPVGPAENPKYILITATKVEVNKEPCLLTICLDVTAWKRAEEALHASEMLFRAVFDHAPQPITIVRTRDNRYTNVNEAFTRVFGYQANEIIGQPSSVFVHEDQSEFRAKIAQQIKEQGVVHYLSTTGTTKAGGIVDLIFSSVLVNLHGEPHFVSITNDITELKKSQRELEQRNDELTRFNYTISHDLRTPLISIKNFVSMLDRALKEQNEKSIAQAFKHIQQATDKMMALLDELLQFARVGRVVNEPQNVTLQEIAQEALGKVRERLNGQPIEISISHQQIWLRGDRPRLVELMQNLLDNAIKYIGEQKSPRIDIGAEWLNSAWTFFVRDNGIGIDPNFQHRLFGLFEKINPHTEGAGVGLALVKRIVEFHGGKIWLQSAGLGHGTTFYFTLPGSRHW